MRQIWSIALVQAVHGRLHKVSQLFGYQLICPAAGFISCYVANLHYFVPVLLFHWYYPCTAGASLTCVVLFLWGKVAYFSFKVILCTSPQNTCGGHTKWTRGTPSTSWEPSSTMKLNVLGSVWNFKLNGSGYTHIPGDAVELFLALISDMLFLCCFILGCCSAVSGDASWCSPTVFSYI